MSDNYIIEVRSKSLGITVRARVVVRDGHRFRFYAATRAFNSLESRLFKSRKSAEAAALRHIVERSTRGRFHGIDVPHKLGANATSQPECSTRERPWCLGVIAASSFLTLVGSQTAGHFHTIYDWRLSEGAGSPGARPVVGIAPRSQYPKKSFQRRF